LTESGKVRISSLDGIRLFNAFRAGANALEKRKEHLNDINVFPVPDGDTGNNMLSTIRYITEKTTVSRSVSLTFKSMADAALMGARGNSGLIMAQYIYGISRALGKTCTIDTLHFSESLVKAIPFSEEALSNPVEGTLITVLRDWAEYMYLLSRSIKDFSVILPNSISRAESSLMETPLKLKILARTGVVDAGAQGFVNFLEGINEFLENGDLRNIKTEKTALKISHSHEHPEEDIPSYRYCTEAIIEGENLSRKTLMSEISPFGDSVIVGGHENKYRVHIHTDHPATLFQTLSSRGTLNDQKADDMLRQVQVKSRRRSNIALLTDSSCDLPAELMDKYQIQMMPLRISFDDSTYLDKITIKPERIYNILNETDKSITTSQPVFGEFVEKYSLLSSHYESVIAIHLSDALSGTWNTSLKAAESVNQNKIHVIDSKNLCSGLGLIVLKAAEAISKGSSCENVIRIIEDAIPKTKIFVSLDTLQFMVRGGRISPLKGKLAKLFNLKPIISVDEAGKGTHYGNACSEAGNLRKIIDLFRKLENNRGIWKYAVVHARANDRAQRLAEELSRISGADPAYVMEISPVIGLNSGPGSVAVSMILEN